MRIFTIAVLASIGLNLGACSTPPLDPHVEIFLRPIHLVTTGLDESDLSQMHIIDNDGNLYITYWDAKPADYETFSARALACKNQLSEQRLFVNPLSIADFTTEQITPSVYVPLITCIHAHGYNLVDKTGYTPDSYRLVFSRAHLSRGDYLPIGASYTLHKPKARYQDVYTDVKMCETLTLNGRKDGAVEEIADGFIRASMEVFVNQMKACLTSKSYAIETESRNK